MFYLSEVQMYLIILELLEKWEDALQVIEGPLGGKHIQLSILIWVAT